MNDDVYLNLTGTDFIKPPNSGTVATIPANSTTPQIDERVRNHKENLREYLSGLRNMYTDYVSVITQQMLDHLYENYGAITAVDIEDNDTRMRESYNPTFPIETLFHQMELAVEYDTAGKRPYQTAQVVSRAYLLVFCKLDYTQKSVAIGIKSS